MTSRIHDLAQYSRNTVIMKNASLSVQLTDVDIEELVDSMDVDGNDLIDYHEFVMGIMEDKQLLTEAKLRAAFDYFDRDRNGSIELSKFTVSLWSNWLDSMWGWMIESYLLYCVCLYILLSCTPLVLEIELLCLQNH